MSLYISNHNWVNPSQCLFCHKEREEVEFPESNTDFPKGFKDYRCFDENCEAYCWAGVTYYATNKKMAPEPEEFEADGWVKLE